MSLKYEPVSEPLHISTLNPEPAAGGSGQARVEQLAVEDEPVGQGQPDGAGGERQGNAYGGATGAAGRDRCHQASHPSRGSSFWKTQRFADVSSTNFWTAGTNLGRDGVR